MYSIRLTDAEFDLVLDALDTLRHQQTKQEAEAFRLQLKLTYHKRDNDEDDTGVSPVVKP